MKTLIKSIGILFLILLINSCDKKSEQNEVDNSKNKITEQNVNPDNFDLNATEDGVIVVESYNESDGTYGIRCFNSEEDAYQYAINHPASYSTVKDRIEAVREIRAAATLNGDIDKADNEPISEGTLAVLEQHGFQQKGETPLGVGLLFDYSSCSGSTCGLSGNPQYSLFSFKNKAESAQGVGIANHLWDRTWFRGPSIYLLLGTAQCVPFNMSNGSFANRAESAW